MASIYEGASAHLPDTISLVCFATEGIPIGHLARLAPNTQLWAAFLDDGTQVAGFAPYEYALLSLGERIPGLKNADVAHA